MRFNANLPLLDLSGKEVKEAVIGDDGRPTGEMRTLTLGYVACIALDHLEREEINRDEKMRRFVLQTKLYDAIGPIEIKSEDAALIKKCVGAHPAMRPYVLGRIAEEIERPSSLDKPKTKAAA
jgi:hypothetical protein